MPAQVAVKIFDEVPGGGRREACTLRLESERITARELIARRVRQEVEAYYGDGAGYFRGLVQPTDAEQVLNGWRVRAASRIDPGQQIASALDAFTHGRVLLLVDDREIDALDDPILLREHTEICFYKLVPLVGG
jgi:hypothetical protein